MRENANWFVPLTLWVPAYLHLKKKQNWRNNLFFALHIFHCCAKPQHLDFFSLFSRPNRSGASRERMMVEISLSASLTFWLPLNITLIVVIIMCNHVPVHIVFCGGIVSSLPRQSLTRAGEDKYLLCFLFSFRYIRWDFAQWLNVKMCNLHCFVGSFFLRLSSLPTI